MVRASLYRKYCKSKFRWLMCPTAGTTSCTTERSRLMRGKLRNSESPASLSRNVYNYIRRDMKFSGVIISDGLAMKGVTDFVGGDRGTAAVRAVQAGNDMLCVTGNYTRCYNALVSAAKKGAISESQIDASVKRILKMKIRRGIIK